MVCKNCNIEMETGMLIANGTTWINTARPKNTEGGLRDALIKAVYLGNKVRAVDAWKCPKCLEIHLFARE